MSDVAYRLSPCPVGRHHVTVAPFGIFKLLVGRVVYVAVEFWVGEDALDHLTWVAEPNLVLRDLPLWWAGSFGWRSVIAQAKALPGNIPEGNGIDLSQQIGMVGYGRLYTVGDQTSSPEFE